MHDDNAPGAPGWVIQEHESVMRSMERLAQAKNRADYRAREDLKHGRITADEYDDVLAKGVPTGTADQGNYTIRDLAPVAVNTQWTESSPFELTLYKGLPDEAAALVAHEWTSDLTYYQDGFNGHVGEFQRGVTVRGTQAQDTIYSKMMAIEAATSYIAGQETALIESMGTKDPTERERRRAQLAMMYLQNINMFRMRSDVHRQGDVSGTNIRGIEQQIEEGTQGANVTQFSSDFGGSHVIDFLGGEPSFNNVRAAELATIMLFQGASAGFMAPDIKAGFAKSLDGAVRLNGDLQRVRWGKNIDSVNVGIGGMGSEIHFITENALSPIYYQKKYTTNRPNGYPSTLPVVESDSGAQTDGATFNSTVDTVTSLFDSNPEGFGEVYYVITYVKNGVESLGVRYPSSGTDTVTVSQEYAFRVSAPTDADTIRVYRGQTDATNTAMTDAWHIFDVAASATGQTIFFDNNEFRPNTSRAFFFPFEGPLMNAIQTEGSADAAMQMLTRTGGKSLGSNRGGRGNNGVRCVRLGPKLAMIEMAKLHYLTANPAAYISIYTPLVPDPRKCFVFKNIRSSVVPSAARP